MFSWGEQKLGGREARAPTLDFADSSMYCACSVSAQRQRLHVPTSHNPLIYLFLKKNHVHRASAKQSAE